MSTAKPMIGRRRPRDEDCWKQNVSKRKRNKVRILVHGFKPFFDCVIETNKDYIDLIENLRDPLFKMVDVSEIKVLDFESRFSQSKDLKKIKISKVVKIAYFPDGEIHAYYSYDQIEPTKLFINCDMKFESLENALLAEGVGISEEKLNDLKRLLRYLSPEMQDFYENLFKALLLYVY